MSLRINLSKQQPRQAEHRRESLRVSDDFWLNDDYPYRVVIQPDGKILIGGNESGVSYSVLRLNPDGSADTSFGGAGVGRAHAGLGWGYDMALQSDGKILIAGEWGSLASVGGDSTPYAGLIRRRSTTIDPDRPGSISPV